MDDERRWLREVRDSALDRLLAPWHLEGCDARTRVRSYLVGTACTTTFIEPDRLEWRAADDPPPERDRCDACQGAYLRGTATA